MNSYCTDRPDLFWLCKRHQLENNKRFLSKRGTLFLDFPHYSLVTLRWPSLSSFRMMGGIPGTCAKSSSIVRPSFRQFRVDLRMTVKHRSLRGEVARLASKNKKIKIWTNTLEMFCRLPPYVDRLLLPRTHLSQVGQFQLCRASL